MPFGNNSFQPWSTSTEMQLAVDREQVRRVVDGWRQSGSTIAFVPTMGNLHKGHLALISTAQSEADRVIASIYVNPTQFGEGEDYANYPRTFDDDSRSLESCGCDLLFAPGHTTVYPLGFENAIRLVAPHDLASILEGRSRPGHFDGVVSVVARLFHLVRPDLAVFGEKDFQQLLLIRRLVDDLSLPVRIVSVPTVRETSGLAMSSRNNYLDSEQRGAAASLSAVLADAASRVGRQRGNWIQVEQWAMDELSKLGFRVDYVAVRTAAELARPDVADAELRILAAAWFGDVRLIDNMKII